MAEDMVLERRGAESSPIGVTEWTRFTRTYELRVVLSLDSDGGYTAEVARLPGVVSEGETEQEALANIRDAFQGAAVEYLEESGSIPWCEDTAVRPTGSVDRRILVDV
jgi:predicted RNase H-like HicB family nuclease